MPVREENELWDSLDYKQQTQTAFLMSFLYIYVRIPWNGLTSYMLNWAIEIFLDMLDKTESAVLEGTFDSSDWLWICLYGASAAGSIVLKFKDDFVQKAYWEREFGQKLRWISDVLQIKDWDTAARLLTTVHWDTKFEGEGEIRKIWEVALAN